MLALDSFQLSVDVFALCVVDELQKLVPKVLDLLMLAFSRLEVLVRDARSKDIYSESLRLSCRDHRNVLTHVAEL